jgi:hypothetical protein
MMGEAKRRFKPGTELWGKRRDELLAKERENIERWHYVSFADTVFRGVVIMRVHGVGDAVTRTHLMGINPGGEVLCLPMPDEIVAQVPEKLRNKLLTKEEVLSIWPDSKSLKEHEAEQKASE